MPTDQTPDPPGDATDPRPAHGGPSITAVDHVAIAVEDLEAAISHYQSAYGAALVWRETIEQDGVDEALLAIGASHIQLIAPTRGDSTVARFLARRGPGLHHVAYRTADLPAALSAMAARGMTLVDREPRPGGRGTAVAFVHPQGNLGVLVELVAEHPEVPDGL